MRWMWAFVVVAGLSCGRPPAEGDGCEAGETMPCACPDGEGRQTCLDDGSTWGACECDGASESSDGGPACPAPELSVALAGFLFTNVELLFNIGTNTLPPASCFTTGTTLYGDSRIDLFAPGSDEVLVSMPAAFVVQPAALATDPIRLSPEDQAVFGATFQSFDVAPSLDIILQEFGELDGYVKLCNADGACDELTFAFQTF